MKKCFGIIIYTYFKEFPEREKEGGQIYYVGQDGSYSEVASLSAS